MPRPSVATQPWVVPSGTLREPSKSFKENFAKPLDFNPAGIKRIETRLYRAGFEETCRLGDFDWSAPITLDRRLPDATFSLESLDECEHVLLVGPARVGLYGVEVGPYRCIQHSFIPDCMGYPIVEPPELAPGGTVQCIKTVATHGMASGASYVPVDYSLICVE